MKVVAFLLLIVRSCIAFSEEGTKYGSPAVDVEKSSRRPPQEYLHDLNVCLARRLCYSRVKDIEVFCCKSSFSSGSFNRTDINDCVDELPPRYLYDIFRFFEEKGEKFDMIEEKIMDAVGDPRNEGECSKYSDEMEDEQLLMCKKNKDEDLVWLCDLLKMIMRNSRLEKRTCMEDFGKCIVGSLTMSKFENASIKCCKEAILNRDEYYKLKEQCLKKNIGPIFMNCMNASSKECMPVLVAKYFEDKDAIEKVKNTIENIMGVPNNILYCKSQFRESVKILLGICKTNTDEKLSYFCELSRRIVQSSGAFMEEDEYPRATNGLNTAK